MGYPEVTIREIESVEDLHMVEELQKEIWGVPDLDVVPLYHLVAAKLSGGVLLGAFDGEEMIGFVYGFVGRERGQTVHHSHMLAVKPVYRSANVGYRLKCEQRRLVMNQGLDIMTWTFDPLQSLNAFFNFRKLGIVADRYYPDIYGTAASSFLHRNGTDRLWVTWHLSSERVEGRLDGSTIWEEMGELPVLIAVSETGAPVERDVQSVVGAEHYLIEIPADINLIESESLAAAKDWRTATRQGFMRAMEAGFIVHDFHKKNKLGRQIGVYVLARGTNQSAW